LVNYRIFQIQLESDFWAINVKKTQSERKKGKTHEEALDIHNEGNCILGGTKKQQHCNSFHGFRFLEQLKVS
jgi:hypothetical protein